MKPALSDALIMAFADGELDAALAERVRHAIETDARVRHKHEIFRETRRVLASVFDDILADPVPARLTELLTQPAKEPGE